MIVLLPHAVQADDFEVGLPTFLDKQGGEETPTSTSIYDYATNRIHGLDILNLSAVQAATEDIKSYTIDEVETIRDSLLAANSHSGIIAAAHAAAYQGAPPLEGTRTNLEIARGATGLADGAIALHEAIGEPLSAVEQLDLRQRAASVPSDLAKAVALLEFAALDALNYLEAAYLDLNYSAAERVQSNETLIESLHRRMMFNHTGGNVTLYFSENTTSVLEAASSVAESINQTALYQAADVMAQAMDEVDGIDLDGILPPGEPSTYNCGAGYYVLETPQCVVVIGNASANIHRAFKLDTTGLFEANRILFDLGGQDSYEMRAGGGRGDLQRMLACLPCGVGLQVTVDVGAGDDKYDRLNPKVPGGPVQGAGEFGLGVLYDDAGNDYYAATHLSQFPVSSLNAGIIAQGAGTGGLGMLVDPVGNDTYVVHQRWPRTPSHGQAVGLNGGVGILWDRSGEDRFFFNLTQDGIDGGGAQAFAFEQGAAFLLNHGGDSDLYEGGQDLVQGAASATSLAFFHDAGGDNSLRVVSSLGCPHRLDDVCGTGPSTFPIAGWSHGYSDIGSVAIVVAGVNGDRVGYVAWNGDADRQFEGLSMMGAGNTTGTAVFYDPVGDDIYDAQGEAIGFGGRGVGIFIDTEGDDQYWCSGPTCIGRAQTGLGVYYDGISDGDQYEDGDPRTEPWAHGELGIGVHLGGV